MSRRTLTYAALVLVTYVLAACAQPTAPQGSDTTSCKGGWGGSNTKSC